MTTNVNIQTGIRFGIIAAMNCPNLENDILEHGENATYAHYKAEHLRWLKQLVDANDPQPLAAYIADNTHWNDQESKKMAEGILVDQDGEKATADDLLAIYDHIELADEFNCEEPTWRYTDKQGNAFEMSYLGGAPLIWCLKTDKVVLVKSLCSLCIPNGGDLDSGIVEEGGYECYGVPDQYF